MRRRRTARFRPFASAGGCLCRGTLSNGCLLASKPLAKRLLARRPKLSAEGCAPMPIEPIEIGKFFKNRKGDFVVVQIKQFEGFTFLDVRQFFTRRGRMYAGRGIL